MKKINILIFHIRVPRSVRHLSSILNNLSDHEVEAKRLLLGKNTFRFKYNVRFCRFFAKLKWGVSKSSFYFFFHEFYQFLKGFKWFHSFTSIKTFQIVSQRVSQVLSKGFKWFLSFVSTKTFQMVSQEEKHFSKLLKDFKWFHRCCF